MKPRFKPRETENLPLSYQPQQTVHLFLGSDGSQINPWTNVIINWGMEGEIVLPPVTQPTSPGLMREKGILPRKKSGSFPK